ncbi:MAG: hypothetical protein ACOZEN_02700 [Thermodesulfobacteriota bacterium]
MDYIKSLRESHFAKRWARWVVDNDIEMSFFGLGFFVCNIVAALYWMKYGDGEAVAYVLSVLSASFFGAIQLSKFIINDKRIRDMSDEEIFSHIICSDVKNDWTYINTARGSEVYCKKDIRLRFVSLYSDDGIHNGRFVEKWATCFPDKNAISYWCDLCYDGSIIRRFVLVAVDGARAFLPLPKIGTHCVGELELKVAQIHDELNTLNDYFTMSGLTCSLNGQSK